MDVKLNEEGKCLMDGQQWQLVPCNPTAAQTDAFLKKANRNRAKAWDLLI